MPRSTELDSMVRAFIMLKVEGDAQSRIAPVTSVDHVEEANVVAGDFDVIAEAAADEVRQVMHTASADIRAIEGVRDTKTYVCLE